jgi:hypothetical protein
MNINITKNTKKTKIHHRLPLFLILDHFIELIECCDISSARLQNRRTFIGGGIFFVLNPWPELYVLIPRSILTTRISHKLDRKALSHVPQYRTKERDQHFGRIEI